MAGPMAGPMAEKRAVQRGDYSAVQKVVDLVEPKAAWMVDLMVEPRAATWAVYWVAERAESRADCWGGCLVAPKAANLAAHSVVGKVAS